jgi:hypothetical protein
MPSRRVDRSRAKRQPQFYDASTGLAPVLGNNCIGPSGLTPNMCNRGEPGSFLLGPVRSAGPPVTFWYVLRADIVQGIPLLQQAASDPCKFKNDGQGSDGYVPGSRCPDARPSLAFLFRSGHSFL